MAMTNSYIKKKKHLIFNANFSTVVSADAGDSVGS